MKAEINHRGITRGTTKTLLKKRRREIANSIKEKLERKRKQGRTSQVQIEVETDTDRKFLNGLGLETSRKRKHNENCIETNNNKLAKTPEVRKRKNIRTTQEQAQPEKGQRKKRKRRT